MPSYTRNTTYTTPPKTQMHSEMRNHEGRRTEKTEETENEKKEKKNKEMKPGKEKGGTKNIKQGLFPSCVRYFTEQQQKRFCDKQVFCSRFVVDLHNFFGLFPAGGTSIDSPCLHCSPVVGHNPLDFEVVCPQNRAAVLKGSS